MKGGAKTVVEAHRHEGVFIARGKEDALVTKNMVAGESVYGEKRISVEVSPAPPLLLLPCCWSPLHPSFGNFLLETLLLKKSCTFAFAFPREQASTCPLCFCRSIFFFLSSGVSSAQDARESSLLGSCVSASLLLSRLALSRGAQAEEGAKTEYRVWNPFRSKLAAAILGGVDNIWIVSTPAHGLHWPVKTKQCRCYKRPVCSRHDLLPVSEGCSVTTLNAPSARSLPLRCFSLLRVQKPGSHVLYLGAASGTTVSHVSDLVGPVSRSCQLCKLCDCCPLRGSCQFCDNCSVT